MKNRLIALIIFTILFSIVRTSAKTSADEVICKDVSIIFARGSGQNQNDNYLDNLYDKDYFGEEEKQSFAFFEDIEKRLNGVSVERISLHDFEGRYNPRGYIAIDIATGFTSKPHYRNDVPNLYYESVADGAEELVWFLEDRLTSCPFQQVILGGYSQGAHVVGDTLFKLKPALRPRLAYVALFGDPKFNPRTNVIPLTTGSWVRGSVSATQTGALLARKDYLPDEIANRTSWCDGDDPVCANYSLIANSTAKTLKDLFIDDTHQTSYQEKWIPMAANEIAQTIKDRKLILASRVQTIPWVNKNDKLYQLDLAIVFDTTGSMAGIVNSIKLRLDTFTSALYNSYWDTRVGIVGFNDFQHATLPFYYSKKFADFTYDKEQIKSVLKNISTFYGGDTPEPMYSGLMAAMNELNWRPGAQKKILVITDAPAKDPDPGPGYWTKSQVLNRALELDPVAISLVAFPVNYPWPYTNKTLNKQVDEAFKDSVIDVALKSNGTIVYGQRDYLVDYPINALNQMVLQPVATINGQSDGYINEPLYLSGGNSYDPDGAITSYRWDCNNDGIWEIDGQNQPTAECIYDRPYQGLAVMEIIAADGGSAKAIFEMNVTERIAALPSAPAVPMVAVSRSDKNILVAWRNEYPLDTTIRITDLSDNILGYAAGDSSPFVLADAPQSAFSIKIDALNSEVWSEKTVVLVESTSPLTPSPTPTPSAIPSPTPTPEIAPNITPTPSPIPSIEPSPIPAATAEVTPAPTPSPSPSPTPTITGDKTILQNESGLAWPYLNQRQAIPIPGPTPTPEPQTYNTPTIYGGDSGDNGDNLMFNDQLSDELTSVAGLFDYQKQPSGQNLVASEYITSKQSSLDLKLLIAGLIITTIGIISIAKQSARVNRLKNKVGKL